MVRETDKKQVIFRMDKEDHKQFRTGLLKHNTSMQRYLDGCIKMFLDFVKDPASITKQQRSIVKSLIKDGK